MFNHETLGNHKTDCDENCWTKTEYNNQSFMFSSWYERGHTHKKWCENENKYRKKNWIVVWIIWMLKMENLFNENFTWRTISLFLQFFLSLFLSAAISSAEFVHLYFEKKKISPNIWKIKNFLWNFRTKNIMQKLFTQKSKREHSWCNWYFSLNRIGKIFYYFFALN